MSEILQNPPVRRPMRWENLHAGPPEILALPLSSPDVARRRRRLRLLSSPLFFPLCFLFDLCLCCFLLLAVRQTSRPSSSLLRAVLPRRRTSRPSSPISFSPCVEPLPSLSLFLSHSGYSSPTRKPSSSLLLSAPISRDPSLFPRSAPASTPAISFSLPETTDASPFSRPDLSLSRPPAPALRLRRRLQLSVSSDDSGDLSPAPALPLAPLLSTAHLSPAAALPLAPLLSVALRLRQRLRRRLSRPGSPSRPSPLYRPPSPTTAPETSLPPRLSLSPLSSLPPSVSSDGSGDRPPAVALRLSPLSCAELEVAEGPARNCSLVMDVSQRDCCGKIPPLPVFG